MTTMKPEITPEQVRSAILENCEAIAASLTAQLAPKEPELSDLQKKLVAEGWTAHFGSEMPIAGEIRVLVAFRDGKKAEECANHFGGETDWWKHEHSDVYAHEKDIIAYRLAAPPKPVWSLPAYLATLPGYDPERHKPHRDDFTEDMLAGGWRPLLVDEIQHEGDDWLSSQGWWKTGEIGKTIQSGSFYRTRRPLPSAPVTVPWDSPEDVPGPVCWIRFHKQNRTCSLVCAVDEGGVYSWEEDSADSRVKWSQMHEHEYSTDRRTWHPCTKEVAR